jgi:hypothetical protein
LISLIICIDAIRYKLGDFNKYEVLSLLVKLKGLLCENNEIINYKQLGDYNLSL